MKNQKDILDMTCGGRMMWFEKNNPDTLYFDMREEEHDHGDHKTVVAPDIVGDFTKLPFSDNSFWHVVFDPPHIEKLNEKSIMRKKYGTLFPGWRDAIKDGFDEAWRVLKPNGTLIFKWNEGSCTVREVLDMIPYKPLYGHTTGKSGKTKWMAFFKRAVT